MYIYTVQVVMVHWRVEAHTHGAYAQVNNTYMKEDKLC